MAVSDKKSIKINSKSVNNTKHQNKYYKKIFAENKHAAVEEENVFEDVMGKPANNRTVVNGLALRDITNRRCREDEGKPKVGNHRRKKEEAQERWRMLAKALLDPKNISPKSFNAKDVSVRRFASFNLVIPHKLDKLKNSDNCWSKYVANVLSGTYEIEIHHLEQRLTPKQLVGFNNTGNICIWPSEEVLAFYLLSKVTFFKDKEILEVGGGMACLAGLMLAKYGELKSADLTDGNPVSVNNVKSIVSRNELVKTAAFQLDWVDHGCSSKKYDVVLSSDCLFFDETRQDLVETIWNSTKEDGLALVMAPKRGSTLDSFVVKATDRGFHCFLRTKYDEVVWQQHLRFKKFLPEYEEDLHYPLLLLLAKSTGNIYLTNFNT